MMHGGSVGVELSPGICPALPGGDRRGQGRVRRGAGVAAKTDIIRGVVTKWHTSHQVTIAWTRNVMKYKS